MMQNFVCSANIKTKSSCCFTQSFKSQLFAAGLPAYLFKRKKMNLQNMFKEIAYKRNAASERRAEAALRPGLQQPVDSPTAGSPMAAEDHQPQKPRAAQSTAQRGQHLQETCGEVCWETGWRCTLCSHKPGDLAKVSARMNSNASWSSQE